MFFGIASIGQHHIRIIRSATAARADMAAFTLGSRLAALDGGIANALLGALTGSQISLSVMDYNALLGADVDLFAFCDALRAQVDVQAVSFDRVLGGSATSGGALQALATALDAGGSAGAAAAARRLAGQAGAGSVALNRLIDLGAIGAQDRVAPGQSIRVNAFDLLSALLQLANGSRQVQLDLGANVPGLAGVTAKLALGDRPVDSPWLAITSRGTPVVRTAQTRLYIEARVAPAANLLGIASVRLPVYIELAEAEARLSSIACAGGRSARAVALEVHPAIGHASIADLPADLSDHRAALAEGPARLVSLPLVSVNGQARIDLTAPGWQTVNFTADDIAQRRIKTVSSNSLVQGIAASLVARTALSANVAGLGLSAAPVTSLVGVALVPAAPALDGVVNALTGLLGIHLGQADVRINGARCGVPALVG